jgi:hypothetical protein
LAVDYRHAYDWKKDGMLFRVWKEIAEERWKGR